MSMGMRKNENAARIFSAITAVMLLLAACGGNGGTTAPAATTPVDAAAPAATTASTDAVTAAVAAGATTAAPVATEAAPAETLSAPFTFWHIGSDVFQQLDINNHSVINFIRERANVDVTVTEVPPYVDMDTRFELMMASGDIPDLVEFNGSSKMKEYGEKGAFRPVQDLMDASPVFSSMYTHAMRASMQSPDGNTYLFQSWAPEADYYSMMLRLDLLEQVGYTYESLNDIKTVDDLTEAARKVKAKFPDSYPFLSPGFTYRSFLFYEMFNTAWGGWKYYPEDREARSAWADGNITKAVAWLKQVRDDGLLDPEWVTTSASDEITKRVTLNSLALAMTVGSYGTNLGNFGEDYFDEGQTHNRRLIPVAIPMADGVGVTTYGSFAPLLANWSVAINAKVTDEAKLASIMRMLELMAADKDYETLMCYGIEGLTFEYVNGEPSPLPEYNSALEPGTESSLMQITDYYNFFHPNAATRSRFTIDVAGKSLIGAPPEEAAVYVQRVKEQDGYVDRLCNGKKGLNYLALADPLSDDLLNRIAQLGEEQTSLVARAAIGEISMEDFEKERVRIVEQNQDITAAYAALVEVAKARYG
jgi:putative aldouronate transport system substrate-binding protein